MVKRTRDQGCVLMLDFDGVLSPLVKTPSEARISPTTRRALAMCAKKMPVAIISGRTLPDIEKQIGLKDITYAGSHGLEWKINGRVYRKRMSRKSLSAYAEVRRSVLRHAKLFPHLCIEDKRNCLALGYRSLTSTQVARFRRGALAIAGKSVRAMDNLYTFEIMAASEWTKGECALHIHKMAAKRHALAVYIGDSLTDEDAFRALKSGITIRVGKSSSSAAEYYFKSRASVDKFLRNLV